MSYTAKKLIAIAEAEVDYHEKASNSNLDSKTANSGSNNYTKYARDLYNAGYYNGNKNGYAWCDVFVDWCFLQLTGSKTTAEALECQTGTLGAGCGYSKQYYKNAGRLDSTPQEGDQVFFKQDGSVVHTGIVTSVTSSTIKTIEGNSSDQVKENTYSRSSSYIDSYGHPLYDEDDSTETTTTSTATATGTVSTGSDTHNKAIWTYLYSKLGNAYGAAGLMGNLYAESGLVSNNLQNTYNTSLGYTDAAYTAAVDDGSYTKFSSDSAGFGLAQWTYSTRKAKLLAYAQSKSKSIGDYEMQLEFLINELTSSYAGVLKTLKNATTVLEASNSVLKNYENPANQGTTVQNKRASYGQTFYDKYASSSSTSTSSGTSTSTSTSSSSTSTATYIKKFQTWLNSNYSTGLSVDGVYGSKTKKAAIKALQTWLNKTYSTGLSVDGIYGVKTKAAIKNHPIKSGAKHNGVYILQGMLYCVGYDPNGFDGSFGSNTLAAVKKFQTAKSITVDGSAGSETFTKLFA